MPAIDRQHLDEIRNLLGDSPEADRLAQAYEEAVAWTAAAGQRGPSGAQRDAAEMLRLMERLEHEIRELRGATETRWDGRSSAFLQADALAAEDRRAWLDALRRVAGLLEQVRAAN